MFNYECSHLFSSDLVSDAILTLNAAAAQTQAADVGLGGRLTAQLVAGQVAEDRLGGGHHKLNQPPHETS